MKYEYRETVRYEESAMLSISGTSEKSVPIPEGGEWELVDTSVCAGGPNGNACAVRYIWRRPKTVPLNED